jgi:N-acetylglucosaminyldiphosphoundecaprenol N-acetyl-beta-D-mannosaminyltransferase
VSGFGLLRSEVDEMGSMIAMWGRWFIPSLGCLGLFMFVQVMRVLGGYTISPVVAAVLAAIWGVTVLGQVLQLRLLNRIGGATVVLIATLLVLGSLLPRETITRYPQVASERMATDFDTAWKAIYGKNLFTEFSLHETFLNYADSLAQFDIHRAGQVVLFAIFGISLGICFLFPLDPARRLQYGGYLLLLLIAGGIWALQLELLQMLSPSREVTFVGFLESLIGVFLGVIGFALFQAIRAERKQVLSDRRFNVLGVGIDAVNMQDCLELFEEIIQGMPSAEQGMANDEGGEVSITTLSSGLRTRLPAMTTAMGVAGIVEARRNPRLQRILNESVLNTPDGMPLVWLGHYWGYRNMRRVYGPDLLRDVCAYGEDKGWKHFFYGAAPGIVEKLRDVLLERHPRIEISGIYCPPFRPLNAEEEAELIAMVEAAKPDIFWVGISTPKQLYFMDSYRDKLACKIICPVGYAFDVNAGVEIDAPDWIKYAGLQWLHRGIKQPRLWKRYLPDNPSFIIKSLSQLMHLVKFPSFLHERRFVPFMDSEGYPRFPAGVVTLSAMSLEGARDRVAHWIETKQRHYVNICTADTVTQCYDYPELAKIVSEAGMATTDGMPLLWMARFFGFNTATRVYGPDLMLELCRLSEEKGYSHYFYGATDEVLAELKTNLMSMFPALKIAGVYSPPFRPLTEEEKEEVAERINEAKPDIVWCGLGTPKQDYWVAEFRPRLNCAAILAVGAAFNFHAGHVRQAPRWMMKSGLEWLFRLMMEPKRLWRRYVIGNPRFVLLVIGQFYRAFRYKSYCRKRGIPLQ